MKYFVNIKTGETAVNPVFLASLMYWKAVSKSEYDFCRLKTQCRKPKR